MNKKLTGFLFEARTVHMKNCFVHQKAPWCTKQSFYCIWYMRRPSDVPNRNNGLRVKNPRNTGAYSRRKSARTGRWSEA